jgi:hypothetical protein
MSAYADFDLVADVLVIAASLPREEAFAELRAVLSRMDEGPLRRWALMRTAVLLGLPGWERDRARLYAGEFGGAVVA